MKTGFFGLFWVLCLFPAALHAVPKLEKKIATEVVKEFNEEPRKVRTDAELLPVGYVEIGGKSDAYTFAARNDCDSGKSSRTCSLSPTWWRMPILRQRALRRTE